MHPGFCYHPSGPHFYAVSQLQMREPVSSGASVVWKSLPISLCIVPPPFMLYNEPPLVSACSVP